MCDGGDGGAGDDGIDGFGTSTASESDANDDGTTSAAEAAAGIGGGSSEAEAFGLEFAPATPTPNSPDGIGLGTMQQQRASFDNMSPQDQAVQGILGAIAQRGLGLVPGIGTAMSIAQHAPDQFGLSMSQDVDSAVAEQEATAADAGAGDAYGQGGLLGNSPGRQTAINSLMSNTSPASFTSGYNPGAGYQWGGIQHPLLEQTQPINTNPWSSPYEWKWYA